MILMWAERKKMEKNRLGKVTLDNLTPLMVLGADVRDRSGRLLLGAGTEVTERHLHILRTWGVVEVEIVGIEDGCTDTETLETLDQELLESIERTITPIFYHTDRDHPAIRELMRMRITREAKSGKI
jgi:hypothetical protein